jgi:ABC-type multidrug transport system fused ATPase/permease subunit
MKIIFKNSFLGYLVFFYEGTGYRLFVNFFLCVVVSFFDGVGLTMFMPLMQSVGDRNSNTGKESIGQLHYITDAIQKLGFTLNIDNVLILLLLLFILKGAVKFIQLNYQNNLKHGFIRKIRFNLVSQLQQLKFKGFLKLDAGKIQNILTTELQRVSQSMFYYFISAQAFVMLLTYIVFAFLANYQFALLVATGAALSNLFYRRVYIATKKASVKLSREGNKFNSFLIQAILHFKYLKSTNYFSDYSKRLRQVINQTESLNKRIGFYNSITMSLKEPSIIIIVVLVIKLQISLMGTSLSSILLSLLLFYRALSFLIIIQNNWQSFINNTGSISAVADLSKEMEMEKEVQTKDLFDTFNHELFIKEVSFSYGIYKVLDNVTIKIPKNHTIALIGESGSGKTTLANMVSCLIFPDQGQLFIDNKSLWEYNLDSYRNKIGYISQESVIFTDNVFNNITFWADPTPENVQRFWEIVELVSLKEFLKTLPEKELTQLGDNGISISGGQRQRISIARELYKKAEILILDEATSALDSETERIVQENIEKLHGRYTMIIIAHRLSTIKNVDKIYLLEKGKIIASGNFKDMIEYSDRFKRMVALQEI